MYLVYIWFTCLAEIIHLLNGTIIKGYVWLQWAASDLIEKKIWKEQETADIKLQN